MNRHQLEHVIRASGGVAGVSDIVIVGSQSILGQFPDAPDELLVSLEADVYPKNEPAKSIIIDGVLGELSTFHQTFGYYAHGVSPETAILPADAAKRLIPIQNENTQFVTGWCLEVHDLAASKLAAGREKDMEFVAVLLSHQLVSKVTLQERVRTISIASKAELASDRLAGLLARIKKSS